ncbi:phasin family protein [Methylobacterium nodulans]|uniref:Phasin n=1 Tax=Methylobacterium nodulans (strain LMG 21967 / CNCM I-2342 / ORS 2060) TaxID=460265 RepID=B8IBZ3_METNO|nr:phasin family protein [Methylobacterium nodulans]ACL61175.1 phasin [Methylobacterium nodulans ORS 2060]
MTIQNPFEVPAELRNFADKSLAQAQQAVAAFFQNTRKLNETVQSSFKTAQLPVSVAYARSLDFAEQNANAAFAVAHKIIRARDLQEAGQVQAEYLRAQFDTFQAQAKEIYSVAKAA